MVASIGYVFLRPLREKSWMGVRRSGDFVGRPIVILVWGGERKLMVALGRVLSVAVWLFRLGSWWVSLRTRVAAVIPDRLHPVRLEVCSLGGGMVLIGSGVLWLLRSLISM